MSFILKKNFTFEASHQLPHHDGKCARLHGHSWGLVVWVEGDKIINEGSKQGMVIDYADIKKVVKPLLDDYLDHWHLNQTTGLLNPTSETLAKWIYEKLSPLLPNLYAVELRETCTSACIYRPTKCDDGLMG
jgi:6-pyruvoyltetrahydropterin/6-carboxytetrahydropterin synthase